MGENMVKGTKGTLKEKSFCKDYTWHVLFLC
jgi:hypothetical protein